jgi:hypothetical protein
VFLVPGVLDCDGLAVPAFLLDRQRVMRRRRQATVTEQVRNGQTVQRE